MGIRFAAFGAALAVATLAAGSPARAMESVSVLGTDPAATCATAAAEAIRSSAVVAGGLAACDDAIKHSASTRSELAADYLNRSVLRLVAQDYARAISDDTLALNLNGDLPEAFINRGVALSAQKRFADAVDDFGHALTLNPQHPSQVYFDRGLAREDLGDLKAAYLDYLKAAQLDPTWDRPKAELSRFTVTKAAQG